MSQSFQFITRVDDSAPLISRGTLTFFVKRLTKKLKTMRIQTTKEKNDFNRLKIIRDEVRKLKNEL